MSELTYERANELLRYEPETGKLYWKVNRGTRGKAGHEAGHVTFLSGIPYIQIGVDGALYSTHRVAWLLHFGKWPEGDIDHINGNGLDNRITNLRDVSRSMNLRNRRRSCNNTSGCIGVHWHKPRRKWQARVGIDGKQKHIGMFDDIEAAEAAVKKFRAKHGYTKRHGEAA